MSELFFLSCLAIGLASGFLGGLLGIGGGIVIVPTLIMLFDGLGLFAVEHSTPVAVATSLTCIIFISVAAAYTQLKSDKVEWPIVKKWAAPLVAGALLAGYIAPQLPMPVLRSFIGVYLGFVSAVMLTNWKPDPHRRFPGTTAAGGIGLSAGLVSGIAGIGGGNVMVPTMIFFNTPVHRATATSSALGAPLATAGALGYILFAQDFVPRPDYMIGYVHLPSFLAVVTGAVIAAPLGVRVAHRIQPQPLRRLFGALLILAAVRMVTSAFW